MPLGVPSGDLAFLGYPDQGTLAIWTSHWGDAAPYRSPLLRATAVPYAGAYRPGAAYTGECIVADLMAPSAMRSYPSSRRYPDLSSRRLLSSSFLPSQWELLFAFSFLL